MKQRQPNGYATIISLDDWYKYVIAPGETGKRPLGNVKESAKHIWDKYKIPESTAYDMISLSRTHHCETPQAFHTQQNALAKKYYHKSKNRIKNNKEKRTPPITTEITQRRIVKAGTITIIAEDDSKYIINTQETMTIEETRIFIEKLKTIIKSMEALS